jgi:hypothetical protein
MNVSAKLTVFTLALVAVFGGTYAAGALTGPVASGATDHEAAEDMAGPGHESTGGHGAEEAAAAKGPGGLAVSADGYSLRQVGPAPTVGTPGELAFQILDPSGRPVTGFQTSHDKQLHLIVVRRDLTGFQHVHPTMTSDGTWRTPLTLPAAGQWRVFADFLPAGRDQQVILGLDVPVAGDYQPQSLPAPAPTGVVDDYTVTVQGNLVAGRTSRLTLTVAKVGVPVTDLQPYLGAYGHLVVLRAGDLGYLHVHPQQTDTAGPGIVFDAEVPTAGAYRMFLDFQHAGVVRAAAFTSTAE